MWFRVEPHLLARKAKEMKVTVLVENTATGDLQCEHGLSFFIEFQGENYLLDAGSTNMFMENAKTLGIPLPNVEKCILSHGHYDHAGGFVEFLEENKEASLYMMKTALQEYYSASGGMHYIGVPKELVDRHEERFVCVDQITEIEQGVYLIPHSTQGLETIGEKAKLYVRREGVDCPDDFSHELSLVFDTERGLVIFNSCSHGGARNILDEVQKAFPNKKVLAFLGGLHMKGKEQGKEICTFSEIEIQELVQYLKNIGIAHIYTGHCTGTLGLELLKRYGGNLVQELTTGKVIVL